MSTASSSALTFITLALVVLTPLSAFADDAPVVAAAPQETTTTAPAEKPAGRGVGFATENGLFGRAFEQGVKIRIPVLEHWDVTLRGLSAFADQSGEFTWYVGGRAEVVGHSPVYLNLVRLYGGGGPEIMALAHGSGSKTLVGGGGQFGFEFFLSPKMSFYLEVGGHGGNELTAGGTALAGLMFYPFSGR